MSDDQQENGLSAERLREVLSFDPETGEFVWIARGRGIRTGRRAGSVDHSGYRSIRIDGREYYAQRLAWLYVHGRWPRLIRFQNSNRDDCRIENLQEGFYLTTKHDQRTKEGRSTYQKEYRSGRRDRFRGDELNRKFGVDLEQYQRMFVAQGGVCAVCEEPERGTRNGKLKWLAVDHDHDTGKVRGLLCSHCNPMLGYARDNIGTLTRAIAYLKSHAVATEAPGNIIPLLQRSR